MKLSTAIRRFDTQMRADGKSPHTREVYLRDLRLLAKWLRRDANISTITPNRLARFLTSRTFTHTARGKHKAVVSINRSKSALRSFFRFLTDSGCLKNNPTRLIRSAPCTQKPPTILTRREVKHLLSTIAKHKTAIAKRDHLMFSLLLGTGIRLGSLVGLSVGDVDLSGGTLRVNGKRNVEQLVFLNRGLKRGLKTHVVGRNAEGPLFLSVSGNRIGPRQVEFRLKHWLKQAGITRRCTVHTLRHTFASRLYEKTGNLRLIQRALGHRRVATTEIYTRVTDGKLKRAIRNLGQSG
jgi:integrase/recombinase XerC